jgi:signal transduction histidine kinase
MAKETAHQIGTPLSSLIGWVEILKSENVDESTTIEIEKDIERLQTITDRFSKIGSEPILEKKDIVEETCNPIPIFNRFSKKY